MHIIEHVTNVHIFAHRDEKHELISGGALKDRLELVCSALMMYVCINVCVYVYMCIYICMYIFIHTHRYIYIYINMN